MSSTETKRERQKARRAERLAAEQQSARRSGRQRAVLTVIAAIAGLALVGALVYLAMQGTDVTLGVATAQVEGDALPVASGSAGADASVGQTAPTVEGATPDGGSVTIGEGAGTAQAVVFMAHWCPHCQEEAPLIAEWVTDGQLADGVELVAVSTRHDPARPNWPPDEWLEREAFPGEVLVDGDDAVAEAWGLGGTPMWVFTKADGTVVGRYSGQIDADTFAAATAAAAAGDPVAG